MKYFKYSQSRSRELSARIWEELMGLKNYAKVIYKSNWEDAIMDSYLHILRNYKDDSTADLHNYVIRVLGTIYKGKNKHEVSDDTTLEIRSDEVAVEKHHKSNDYTILEESMVLKNENLKECIKCVIPMYIQDFKMFDSLHSRERILDYTDLLNLFSETTIVQAIKTIDANYKEDIRQLFENRKKFRKVFHSMNIDRYKETFDKSLEFECKVGEVVLYKIVSGTGKSKKIYRVNLRKAVNRLMYMLKDELSIEILGIEVWSTLCGFISLDMSEIREHFESEIVGKLIVSQKVKTLAYEKGEEWYLSTNKELSNYVHISFFDIKLSIEVEPVVCKII